MRIHVEEESLEALKNALETAGEEYKQNLARLSNLMDEITSGDIQGDAATDLLNKFNDKKDAFNSLAEEIDKAGQYVGAKGTDFTNMISDLKNNLR